MYPANFNFGFLVFLSFIKSLYISEFVVLSDNRSFSMATGMYLLREIKCLNGFNTGKYDICSCNAACL